MAETYVAVLPSTDAAAVKIRNVLNTIGPNDVLQQVISLALADGTLIDPRAIRALTGADVVSIAGTVPVSAVALPLPSGAATEATLANRLADATFTARINTQGQKTMLASTPVVIASDQGAVPVTAAQGTAAATAGAWPVKLTDGTNVAAVKDPNTPAGAADRALVVTVSPNNVIFIGGMGGGAANLPVSIAQTVAISIAQTVAISAVALPLPAGAAADATFTAAVGQATADRPAANTVLDRLAQLQKGIDKQVAAQLANTAAVARLVTVSPKRSPATLMHLMN